MVEFMYLFVSCKLTRKGTQSVILHGEIPVE